MLEYELRYNNDLKRIDYFKKLNAEDKSKKTLNILSISKQRTRKIKNSRLKNSLIIFTVIFIIAAPIIRSEFSVIVFAVIFKFSFHDLATLNVSTISA